MRTLAASICLSLAMLTPVWSEPPDNQKAVTSVKAYKDVVAGEEYYDCLTLLVDKYSIMGAYADDTFRPKEPLRRGELAGWLDRAATRAEELINIVSEEYDGDKESFRKNSRPDGHTPKSLENFQMLLVSDSDPCYKNSYHLAQHFHLLVKGPKGFGGADPVSRDEYSAYLKSLFQYKHGPKGAQPVTRAEAVDSFVDAFQFYLDRIEAKIQPKK